MHNTPTRNQNEILHNEMDVITYATMSTMYFIRKLYNINQLYNYYNICVTNDNEYVPLVVITIRPFLIHDLLPGLEQDQHEGCHIWSRNCLPFRGT